MPETSAKHRPLGREGTLIAPATEERAPSSRRRSRSKSHEPRPSGKLAYISLIVLTILCYLPIFQSDLIWSEYDEVERSPYQSMEHWTEAWTLEMIRREDPVVLTTYFIGQALPLPPAVAHHGINLLLHLTAAILLLKTLEALKLPAAFSASLIFALHPSALQTVFWSGYRSDLLGLLIILAALIFGIRNKNPRDFAILLCLSLLAYMLHPASLVIPLILGLCIFYQKPNSKQSDYNRVLPLVCLALFIGVWTLSGRAGPELFEGSRTSLYAQNLFFHLKQALLPLDSTLFHSFSQSAGYTVGAQNSLLLFLLFLPFYVLIGFNFKKKWARGMLLGLTAFLLLSIYGSSKAGQFVDGSLAFEDHQLYIALPILISLVVCSFGGIALNMGATGRILWGLGFTIFASFQLAVTASFAYSVSDREQMWFDLSERWENTSQPKIALIETIQESGSESQLMTQEQIIDTLVEILELKPELTDKRIMLAQIYRAERQNTNALVQYRRILRETEPNTDFLRDAADLYDDLGLTWDANNVRERIANRTHEN